MGMDRRITRTKKAFLDSYIELLQERADESITISDIIKKADYSRNAFYSHYKNKEDFVYNIIQNEVICFCDKLGANGSWKRVMSREEMEKTRIESDEKLFEHVYQNRILYQLILENRIQGGAVKDFAKLYYQESWERMEYVAQNYTVEGYKTAPDWQAINYGILYQYIGLIQYWINSDFKESPRYMAEQHKNIRYRLVAK